GPARPAPLRLPPAKPLAVVVRREGGGRRSAHHGDRDGVPRLPARPARAVAAAVPRAVPGRAPAGGAGARRRLGRELVGDRDARHGRRVRGTRGAGAGGDRGDRDVFLHGRGRGLLRRRVERPRRPRRGDRGAHAARGAAIADPPSLP
ncbi:MAG: hypothetical protein AVDCRST_MAG38-1327, partial [uncultured Solirubrobacteraceae bacterium]